MYNNRWRKKIRLACIYTPEIKMVKADPIAAKEERDFLNALARQFGKASWQGTQIIATKRPLKNSCNN